MHESLPSVQPALRQHNDRGSNCMKANEIHRTNNRESDDSM